jgi:PAS domain S-box-containing protein
MAVPTSAHGRTTTAAAESLFQSMFDAAPDAMVGVDAAGRIVMANAQTESVFGWSREDLIGRPLETLIPERARGVHPDHRAHYFHQPRFRPMGVGLDLSALRADGTEFPAEISLSVLETDDGVIALGAIRDITDRRQAEEETRKAHEEADHAAAELQIAYHELQAFSYAVAHDLRAPLRAIEGFSEALVEDHLEHLDESGRSALERIRRNVQRMGRMIDALLELSRLVRSTFEASEVDLSAMVREAVEALRESDPNREVTAFVEPDVMAVGDRGLLPLLVQNLVSNAWKFTSPHARATIEFGVTEREGERVFFLRDDGVGFDPRYADKLFKPFQRLHVDDFGGSGIGLATAERIVRRHGGRIWAEGAVDGGATFSFTLSEGST